MTNELCRVSIEENKYQNDLADPMGDDEWWDEDAAMEQYYDEKEV